MVGDTYNIGDQGITEIQFSPADPEGNRLAPITAFVLNLVPGLCFHQLSFSPGLPRHQADMWSISHIESGAGVGRLVWFEKEGPIEYIVRYLSEIDWTVKIEEIRNNKLIRRVISEADHDVKLRELIADTLKI